MPYKSWKGTNACPEITRLSNFISLKIPLNKIALSNHQKVPGAPHLVKESVAHPRHSSWNTFTNSLCKGQSEDSQCQFCEIQKSK